MGNQNDIGKARYVIEGDISDVEEKLGKIKSDTEALEGTTDKATTSMGDSFGAVGEKIEGSTTGVRKLAGALSSTVGVVTAVTGAFTSLVGVLLILKNRNDKIAEQQKQITKGYTLLIESLDDYTEAAVTSVDELNRGFDDVIKIIDSQNEVLKRSALEQFATKAQTFRLNNLEKAQQEDLKRLYQERAQTDIEARKSQIQIAQELADLIEDQEISLLPDDEKTAAQAERSKRIIEEKVRSMNVAISEDDLQRALDNVDKIAAKQAEENRKNAAEKERLDRERADKELARNIENDKKRAEEFQRAMQAATDGLFGSSSQFTTSLKGLLNEVKKINSNVGNLK